MEAKAIIGPEDGSKPRKVLMTSYMWQDIKSGQSAAGASAVQDVAIDIQIAEE